MDYFYYLCSRNHVMLHLHLATFRPRCCSFSGTEVEPGGGFMLKSHLWLAALAHNNVFWDSLFRDSGWAVLIIYTLF